MQSDSIMAITMNHRYNRKSSHLDLGLKWLLQMDDHTTNNNYKEEEWSQLPKLLLWMIFQRLNFLDELRSSVVCKQWLSAFKSRPSNPLVPLDSTSLCIMYERKNRSCSKREFFIYSSRKKLIIDHPDFCGTRTLNSRQGWLLLTRPPPPPITMKWGIFKVSSLNTVVPRRSHHHQVFLLNPIKKASKINFPDVETEPENGVITTNIDGSPEYVVISSCDRHFINRFTLWIARRGDKEWSKHSYDCRFNVSATDSNLFIKELKVYYFCEGTELVVFDISNHMWKHWNLLERSVCKHLEKNFILEYCGEIVMVRNAKPIASPTKFCFYRLKLEDNTHFDWVEMKDEEVQDTSWFLSHRSSFALKDKGIKVYNHWFLAKEEHGIGKIWPKLSHHWYFSIRRETGEWVMKMGFDIKGFLDLEGTYNHSSRRASLQVGIDATSFSWVAFDN